MITLFLKSILTALKDHSAQKKLISRFSEKKFPIKVEGPEGVFLSILITRLLDFSKGSFLLVVPTEKEAIQLLRDIRLLIPDADYIPERGVIPYSNSFTQLTTAGKRISGLMKLIIGKKQIIVTSLRTFLSPLAPPSFLKELLIQIKTGDEFDPVKLEEKISSFGYLRVPKVSVEGEFALRGEVLDVFPPGNDEAVRIVFEFDEVEEIKRFNPISQTSTEKLQIFTISPVKEIIWSDKRIKGLMENIQKTDKLYKDLDKVTEILFDERKIFDEELLFPLSFPEPGSLLQYLDSDASLFLLGFDRLISGSYVLKKENTELYTRACREGKNLPKPDKILLNFDDIIGSFKRRILFPSIKSNDTESIRYYYSGPKSFFGNIEYFREELKNLLKLKYKIAVFAESESQAVRIKYLLKDLSVDVIPGYISGGFSLPDLKIAAIQENEIFGRKKRIPGSIKKVKSKVIDTFVELNPGDFVVHINYGIGRFIGIDRIKAAETERDYIQLEYSDEETIFIPIEQVNLIQRYIGNEGSGPRLDKLGGKSWETRKKKVRKSVEDLAEMLIGLYSKRKNARGYSFSEDTDWQVEFEAAFPFEETEDQLKCIEEVKLDMESSRPMDRLVCGDVGYGKTEVAMRAAFKAVTDGKQVALLAPTTILAEQHFESFGERFDRYPVKIGMVSRFVPRAKQKKILSKLTEGGFDLLIGTHRILQKDVLFKNLGLLIIDEEQRFGVKDKERLKELKTSVDCLTLSATPIPRTLHMSLLKIRDMSLITTAPYNRCPIETIIEEFNEITIVKAIRREIERDGQVFFLHNRIETLESIQILLQKLVPEAVIKIAHGRMSPHELEDIMHEFIHGGFHILAATTIIENGIDIPNVNTIIIDRADIFGISQLYQLRGRVGRSDRKAYAYLLYPEKRSLSEIAMKRLQVISDFTDLGSGFKIALKDLEIRGAGNLLGRQQHGDILSVGFDMYLRLLDEAIAEMSQDESGEKTAPEIYLELDYSGYIPDSYIKEQVEKMEIYKKISGIQSDDELLGVNAELTDRFGPLPDEVSSLLSIAEIRIICKKLFVSSLKERRGVVKVEFSKVSIISVDKVLRLIKESGGSVKLDPKSPQILIMETGVIGLSEKSEFIRDRLSVLI